MAVFTTLSLAWSYTFPSAHYLATLAKLPPDIREDVHWTNIKFAMGIALIVNGIAVGFAWLASFRRQNWARWAFAIGYILLFVAPLVYDAAHHNFTWSNEFPHRTLQDLAHYWVMALWVSAIAFAFTGNARSWFSDHPTVRGVNA